MNICPKCFDDMRMVSNEKELYFVCDDCGNEDRAWIKTAHPLVKKVEHDEQLKMHI
jgi:DNA-directed RNA polymerase subunit M/transcription elongation factor TFIIS